MTSRAVLFDFDGTFADTAPDLAAAVNAMRTKRGLEPLPPATVRPYASMGARGLLRIGFGMTPEHSQYIAMRDEFLDRYARALCVDTRLFPGMPEVIDELGARGIAWGIVTNKATRFTERLVRDLGVAPACVVCGDSTPHLKPHPAPLLLAAKRLELAPRECVYVGDDLRDIQAAHAAGMRSVAVEYGYHGADNPGPATWNADAIISHPSELLEHL
ncbi:MAG TPA: HAD-IIIA family hydrolase [Burkholderiales bacterium]|nr:HAD-IIIA family hydrolase [Burkholderiales bacterium]